MGMRETVGSLRAYFILSGLLTAFPIALLLGGGIFSVIVGLITVGFGLAFLYVGFTLPKLLRVSAGRIVTLLYANGGWTVLLYLLSLFRSPSAVELVYFILALLIVWYLLKNVRRLAAEAQAAPSEPPPPGA